MKNTNFNFNEVYDRYGTAGRDAAAELCSMFRRECADWLASLWDGNVGAFYYATSSRVTDGYLPDSESTIQALGLLRLLGMFTDEHDISDKMKRKMGEFAYSLQDPDGYFYHPQWKEMMLKEPKRFSSRRGRDFGQCLGLLQRAGMKPKYPTALDNLAKAREGGEVSESATLPEHLRSREAFIKYLDELDINTNSYPKGHELSSQAAQIKAAGLAEVCVEYMASKQNKENGTWESQVDIHSINGVTKIGTAFTSLGARIPNADIAFRSAISVALVTDRGPAITATYNPFWTMNQMLAGFRSAGLTEDYNTARDMFFEHGTALISATATKLRHFFHEPESAFHYCHNGSSWISQNVPASLGLLEGDVNATSLGIDTVCRVFDMLELPIGKPCDTSDGVRFLEKIGEL
jgi:hypothetical protein